MKTYTHLLLFFLVCILSCKLPFEPSSDSALQYKIESSAGDTLSEIEKVLRPYRDSLNKSMHEVIGFAMGDLIKEKPGGSLGFLVVDAMYEKAKQRNAATMNAVCNYGGIRLPEIKKGEISRGKIFELLPFDNELVLLEVKGDIMQQWVSFMDSAGGWPVRRPLRFDRDGGKELYFTEGQFTPQKSGEAQYITEKKFIDKNAVYIVATNDYLANGGDNCGFLKQCPREYTGILIRDLMIEYIKHNKNIYPAALYQVQD